MVNAGEDMMLLYNGGIIFCYSDAELSSLLFILAMPG